MTTDYGYYLGAAVAGTTAHGDPFTGTVVRVDNGAGQVDRFADGVARPSSDSGPILSIDTGGIIPSLYRLPEFGWKHQWLQIATITLAAGETR